MSVEFARDFERAFSNDPFPNKPGICTYEIIGLTSIRDSQKVCQATLLARKEVSRTKFQCNIPRNTYYLIEVLWGNRIDLTIGNAEECAYRFGEAIA